MNYPKKTGFNLYESRNCAYITYSVKTWFLKNLSVRGITTKTKKITFIKGEQYETKVVDNDSSYWSKFFLFLWKMKKLWPKNGQKPSFPPSMNFI